jgi:hypothetical protein
MASPVAGCRGRLQLEARRGDCEQPPGYEDDRLECLPGWPHQWRAAAGDFSSKLSAEIANGLHERILSAGCGGRPRGRDCGKEVYGRVERLGRHPQGTSRGLGAGPCYMAFAIPHRTSPRARRTSSATPVQGWTSSNTCPQGQVQRRAQHEFKQRWPGEQRLRFTGRTTELVCAASAPGASASRTAAYKPPPLSSYLLGDRFRVWAASDSLP